MEFTVRTKPTGGKYAPRHVIAIWVTDGKGEFVKTLAIYARKQKKRLKLWTEQPQKNEVDAVTGATLKAHRTHTVTWDCRDAKGEPAPDGDFQIHVELADSNKRGPVTPATHIQFKKGPDPVAMTPSPLPCFDLMKLNYTPRDESSTVTAATDTADGKQN